MIQKIIISMRQKQVLILLIWEYVEWWTWNITKITWKLIIEMPMMYYNLWMYLFGHYVRNSDLKFNTSHIFCYWGSQTSRWWAELYLLGTNARWRRFRKASLSIRQCGITSLWSNTGIYKNVSYIGTHVFYPSTWGYRQDRVQAHPWLDSSFLVPWDSLKKTKS